ncbi:MAG: hypothetical protein WBY44_19815 [Bryobacteraceae bacterium]
MLLELAAHEDRVLVTSDRNTMTFHFHERQNAGLPTSGLFVLPQQRVVGQIIEFLLLSFGIGRMAELHRISAEPLNFQPWSRSFAATLAAFYARAAPPAR